MITKVNLVPRLKEVLAGHYDPKGAYVVDPKANPDGLTYVPGGLPTGEISLSSADFECYTILCRNVKYKPEKEAQDLGNGAAMIMTKDLAGALSKATADTEV